MPHFQRRVNRVPTMYSLIYGGQRQGPHTIPFSLIHYFCVTCTAEQLKNLVLLPHEFKKLMDSEEIVDYGADLEQYRKIYNAFNRAIRIKREDQESQYVDCWNGYGWRQLGERLLNLNPYATYHWQSGIDRSNEEERKMLAGKGSEKSALHELKRDGFLSVDAAMRMIDGLESDKNQYLHPENFKEHLIKMLQYFVTEQDYPDLVERIMELC